VLLRHSALQFALVPLNPADRYPDINPKDAHVYAAARASGAQYLVTLDKRLAAETNALAGDPTAISPGDFLQKILPTHPDYATEPAAGRLSGGDASTT